MHKTKKLRIKQDSNFEAVNKCAFKNKNNWFTFFSEINQLTLHPVKKSWCLSSVGRAKD
tara:strand:+ start:1110 stop:1286 length:177 start_codon:yes stop_codon:yes gene_type:complete